MLLENLSPETFAMKLSDPAAKRKLSYLNDLLANSEYLLIQFMKQQNVWQGPFPPPPSGFPGSSQTIELGTVLYLFNNPAQIADPDIRKYAQYAKGALGLPDSLLTTVNYNWIVSHVLVYDDGSIISGGKYETYDQGWFAAFLNMVITDLEDAWFGFRSGSPNPIPLKPRAGSNEVLIALVGDWGTGDNTAAAVMNQLVGQVPRYIVHVGDVYYSGTPATGSMAGTYFHPGEEKNNLVAVWPKTNDPSNYSFTLNSNHEMYTGANGLYGDALTSTTPFHAQQGLTYFALGLGGWTILGLDSAYFGTSTDAFMSGYIGGDIFNRDQINWISGLNLDPSKTIVLTHHTGFEWDGSGFMALWDQVSGALGGDPYAWYWGHVHNGIVYNSPVTMNGTNGLPQTTKTFARCLGHGALPYGEATVLNGNPAVKWMEKGPGLLPNGFGTLRFRLNGNGMVDSIQEQFYHIGSSAPVYSGLLF
ncbi:metallophosphoesterase family protein [Chitinophaga rhizosphaerae]|uniref:metallophosphoesterase family protein n=1 Tax=Chitinophaga rhizosphaerae TaxID=1864947 RepID=UPI000F801DDE|nr:hypothetical protein [Chitinophaga rhizosphaerae]